MIGGFKFGRMANTRRRYWFNYESDVLFIDYDIMDLLRQKEQNFRSTEFLLVALIVAYILCDRIMCTTWI